ncbi:MAG: hypothetical protein LBD67_01950 [Candidatus Accumulibacter sp.]|nr:hypothetical protein [Accumulibacter sp.]
MSLARRLVEEYLPNPYPSTGSGRTEISVVNASADSVQTDWKDYLRSGASVHTSTSSARTEIEGGAMCSGKITTDRRCRWFGRLSADGV